MGWAVKYGNLLYFLGVLTRGWAKRLVWKKADRGWLCGEGIYPRWAAKQTRNHPARWVRLIEVNLVGAAAQPSGSKLPRHGFGVAAASADSISMLGLTDRTQIPVGASLLAMGPGQAHRWWLVYRYREQARSHRYFSVFGPLVLGHAPAWLTHRRPLLWRGSLLPLGCAAAPNHAARWVRLIEVNLVGAASQPSGDKSPRHTSSFSTRGLYLDG